MLPFNNGGVCSAPTYLPSCVKRLQQAPVSRAATSGYGYSCENKKTSSHHELLPEQPFIGGPCQPGKVRCNFAALGQRQIGRRALDAVRSLTEQRSLAAGGYQFLTVSIHSEMHTTTPHRPGGMYVAITSAQTINQRSTNDQPSPNLPEGAVRRRTDCRGPHVRRQKRKRR